MAPRLKDYFKLIIFFFKCKHKEISGNQVEITFFVRDIYIYKGNFH